MCLAWLDFIILLIYSCFHFQKAGLEGVDRQEQARQQLHRTTVAGKSSIGNGQSTTQFIPPDFARHFQSQLTALAAGYYQKLHTDGFAQPYFAPSSAESVSNIQKQQQLQQAALQQLANTSSGDGQLKSSSPGSYTIQQNDPMLLVAQASSSTGLSVNSPQIRDQLLQYAHQLYATGGKQVPIDQEAMDKTKKEGEQPQMRTELHPSLLPLLHTLHKLHSRHLPTLLLLSCAYYSCGDLAASLWYNKEILSIDGNYVESMSNIGTTLRALGRWHEAESWWWRAVKLRPGYWDAYENLLGVLCSPQQIPPNKEEHAAANRVAEIGQLPSDNDQSIAPADRKPETGLPRFNEALKLCEFVESNVLSKRQQATDEGRLRKVPGSGAIASFENAPVYMPMHLPVAQGPRLQNLFYAKGNLKYVLPDLGAVPAAREYERAIEVVLSTSENNAYSVRDLVLSSYVIGVLTMGIALPGAHATHALADIAQAIGLNLQDSQQIQQAAAGQYHLLCPGGGILHLVRKSGDRLLRTLLRLGGGSQLPLLMMLPQGAVQLASILFAETERSLPALVEACRRAVQSVDTIQSTLQQSQTMTSTVLLTLAKLIQDATTRATSGPHGALTLDGIPPSTSLLLPLYYLSITVSPAASTANNLGILLSSIPVSTSVASGTGERQSINGQSLALQYYTYGLTLDPKHPHLYTNFGSLLKDLNHLTEAVQMYEKAIDCNPTFDVALANLGNAIKDQGRTQDSVQYYRRAVEVNPNFPEALCGLVNALLAICDWDEVYGQSDEGKEGFMARVVALLERQLDEGSLYGVGSLCSDRSPEEWANLIVRMTGRKSVEQKQAYIDRIQMISVMGIDGDREKQKINEGSFVIRLVERIIRRTQREWYLDVYGNQIQSERALQRIVPQQADAQKYRRVSLPSCLGTPAVPTVLPFHTFTLKIPPRHIRLISHRTALRISQTTMSQLWLPSNVYPPPAPPAPRIKVGYVSSDFNNHPLAHLMQSTFGFHDRSKFEIFLYATSISDQSPYRKKIEKEAEHFTDVSAWSNQMIISRILDDGVHLLMNLNGYTKGARNEIFAARPCPVQLEFMGFAGGMASSWTDWIVVDPIVCPPEMTCTDIWRKERKQGSQRQRRLTDFDGDRDPESTDNDWVYTEHFIYLPDSYFVNDHRQGFREPEQRQGASGEIVKPHQMSDEEAWREEEKRRWQARKELWPSLPDDYVIFADFNQLYKLEPTLFKLWLRILQRVPNSIIWLLRFPSAGEAHLLRYAQKHFGDEVAARVIFTDVAPKSVHIHRGRIADLFLDTLECGAHTTSADILWSATPVLTWPKHKHKMASRVAASIVAAAGQGDRMIVNSEQAYEDRAVHLAQSLSYTYVNENGMSLKAEQPKKGEDVVQADALSFNAKSSSAAQHTAVNSTGQQVQQQIQKANEAPAPANVKKAEAESKKEEQKQENLDPLPPRSRIELAKVGPQAPPATDSRRSHGELSDLRKELFLSRDSNKLFDTQRWVRHLERGYEEAWKRWVQGIDMEESQEWDALPEQHPAKQSGHIWVRDEST